MSIVHHGTIPHLAHPPPPIRAQSPRTTYEIYFDIACKTIKDCDPESNRR